MGQKIRAGLPWLTISRAWLSAGNPDQALAWAKKGLAKTSDKELLRIKAYVPAHQKYLPVEQ